MIQNRITIVTSSHPSSSKWCCSGAIRNTRLPVSLEAEPTWMMTERVIEDEQAAEDDEQQLGAGEDGEPGEGAAEGQRPGVAHEDLGRRGVPPQEAEAGTHAGGRDDREVVRVAHLVALACPAFHWQSG